MQPDRSKLHDLLLLFLVVAVLPCCCKDVAPLIVAAPCVFGLVVSCAQKQEQIQLANEYVLNGDKKGSLSAHVTDTRFMDDLNKLSEHAIFTLSVVLINNDVVTREQARQSVKGIPALLHFVQRRINAVINRCAEVSFLEIGVFDCGIGKVASGNRRAAEIALGEIDGL